MENMKRLLEFVKPSTGQKITFKTKQYYVSKDGMVYNEERKRFVANHERTGYLRINLFDDDGKHRIIGVHNLVASVFQRLLCKGEVVHHIDKNPKNNKISNLNILTASEHQRQHDFENWSSGRMEGVAAQASERAKRAWASGAYDGVGEKVAAKLRNVGSSRPAKQVAQLGMNGRLVKAWPSTAECQRNGFDQGTISRCCRGERKSHKGFRWQWYEDYQKEKEAQQLELDFSE